MNYESVVSIVKEIVPELEPVEIIYNSYEAECSGSSFFGLIDENNDIMPLEAEETGMFSVLDFVEQEHLPYFKVYLQVNTFSGAKQYIAKEYFEKMWIQNNINTPLNQYAKEIFVILHELGHAHDLYINCNKQLDVYLQSHRDGDNFYVKSGNKKEDFLAFKNTKSEVYADQFAIKYFEEVFNKLFRTEFSVN